MLRGTRPQDRQSVEGRQILLGLAVTALTALSDFLSFFLIATALVGLYLFVYTLATAHNEFALIRQNVVSAAVALGLSLIGFALPLSSAVVHAKTVMDCLMWGLVALVVQILVYWLRRPLLAALLPGVAGGRKL